MRILINDTIDLQADFGVIATKGHLKAIVTPPILKQFSSTNWPDEHGVDYDTSNPVFNARAVSIPFFCRSELSYQRLVSYLEQNIVNKWHFEAINREYMLRLTNNGNVVHRDGRWWFTLTFSEDKPMDKDYYSPPMMEHKTGFKIDNLDFGWYGCHFLKGHVAEINKPFAPKQNLVIASLQTPGQQYPDKNTYYANKNVQIPILFKGKYILQMLDSLVYKLSRPGFREFDEVATGGWFKFIYRSIEVVDFAPQRSLKINLNLEFQETDVFGLLIDDHGNFLVDDNTNTLSIEL